MRSGLYGKAKPLRRAARHQGFLPANFEHPDQLADIVAEVTALRKEAGKDGAEPYDVVAPSRPAAIRHPTHLLGQSEGLTQGA